MGIVQVSTTIQQAVEAPIILSQTAQPGKAPQFKVAEGDWVKKRIEKIQKTVLLEDLDPESRETGYIDLINGMRYTGVYNEFLSGVRKSTDTVIDAVLVSLSQIGYKNIKRDEEDFVLEQLSSNNIAIQEYALNTVLTWGDFYDLAKLESVKIGDAILQKDLTDFINERKRT